jgi:two-component system, NarL family, sensor histidine kinase UhpB
MLSSAKFDLARIVRRTHTPELEELNHIAADLVSLMQETIDTARSISNEMRPISLDLLGLHTALKQAVERFGERHRIAVEVSGIGDGTRVPTATAMQVYRIVQEGLTNVARHAGATRVELALDETAQALTLRLADNGCGIDAVPRRSGSIGLFSMAERAREIGATLDVRPAPAGGTELVLRLPLSATNAATTP